MQPPPKPWKQAIFRAIAGVECALRGHAGCSQAESREIRNFLVLQYDAALGGVVHATPLYEALKAAMPNAHVTVAASSMAASVLRHNPSIDRCVVTPDPLRDFLGAVRALRELLGALPSGPRSVITTIGNRRPRFGLLGMSAGSAVRMGHTVAPALYDMPLTFTPERGQIEGNLDILRRLGHQVAVCEPRVFFSCGDAEYAGSLLHATAEKPDTPRVAYVTQNSRGQRNQWPAERFQQVIASLWQTTGAAPVFIGTVAEADAIESLRRELPGLGISLAGKTTVPQLAAVLAQCDLVVSLDTGPFHVARAVGLPGVVIAPAWQSPLEWLPVDQPNYRVLRGPSLPVVPPDYRMEEIHASDVATEAIQLLQEFPADPCAREDRVRRSLMQK